MTKTNELAPATMITPVAIDLAVSGSLSPDARQTLERLAYALEHQYPRCDAIGECGRKCGLRAGHPGDIHEEYRYGDKIRFRLSGEEWKGK